MKRPILLIIFLVVIFTYSLSKGDDIREETGAHLEKGSVCIRCHVRLPAQKIMMKEDKRCIECHGPEDGMGDLVLTSNREIMPVSMEEKGHDDDMV
ncbi:MAG: c-type cytochrome domain-containing protein, partial [Nitrospirota bacterium]